MPIINNYIQNQDVANKLYKDLKKIVKKNHFEVNLYSICVPKEKFNESCYFSGPYGHPLKGQEDLRNKMEAMQSGEDACGYPQVRILTHKIKPEDGFHVIVHSTL